MQGPADAQTEAGRKRAHWGQDVPDETVASYSAARAFLVGEWFGATLLVASFTLLYLLAFGAHATTIVTYSVCGSLLLLGSVIYLRSRTYYQRIGFDVAPKLHVGALVVGGGGGVFWFLFLFLVVLAWAGVPIQ